MAAEHGTRARYLAGCRCDECKYAQRLYQRSYRDRLANGEIAPRSVAELQPAGPGPVELATQAELAGLAQSELQPGLAAVALAMGRLLDGRAQSSKPSAAKQLADILDTLRKGSDAKISEVSVLNWRGSG